jgi:tetratricopeptide (TPR) repeat protein
LIRLGRAIWQGRANLFQPPANSDGPRIDDSTREDLLDLVVVWANLRVRLAPADQAALASEEALRILGEARDILGSSPSLERDQAAFAAMLGIKIGHPPTPLQAHSAREHLDLGKSYLRSGEVERAAREFRAGLALRPQDFWLNFYDGLSAYRLDRFDEAVSAFRVTIALAPERPECFFNRGRAYQALGHLELALADYDRALNADAHFTDAAMNRGMIHYRLGHHQAASTDLRMALASAHDKERRGAIHYNLALVEAATGDRPSFEADLKAALDLANPDAKILSQRSHR